MDTEQPFIHLWKFKVVDMDVVLVAITGENTQTHDTSETIKYHHHASCCLVDKLTMVDDDHFSSMMVDKAIPKY